ncbi:MAG: helix-turn-helix domain-containing protein [Candidatus Pristimantibacillus sp.]
MDFGAAVKEAMDQRGVKVAEMARTTGRSYQHISDLIKGKRRWNEDTINEVFDALDIKIEICEKEGSY